MNCLYIGFIFFIYNYYVIWGQNSKIPTKNTVHNVNSGNSMVIMEHKSTVFPGHCPKDMIVYNLIDSEKNESICDCRPRFLYFRLNDSCHEAYRQGPCPPKNYVVLPENEMVPRCVENPCLQDGMVQYNAKCYPLRKKGPCASNEMILSVNETTFQLECIDTSIGPLYTIDPPLNLCPKGSVRSTLGICKKKKWQTKSQ
ncbi:uncharacterized protein LOC105208281 [Solenopsis invicta]|uniref:uncharacterized protein LOC105208281 n=1 Tax=Solenopsis invicta TaxID=13686 RepID=UPI0005963051|nr:uncharacterized protein LOC105208281 [Solenopsis invicta]